VNIYKTASATKHEYCPNNRHIQPGDSGSTQGVGIVTTLQFQTMYTGEKAAGLKGDPLILRIIVID
jgi:hypothetical protein